MHRCAVLRFVILLLCPASALAQAQQLETQAKPAQDEHVRSVRQSAISLMEEALAGTSSLSLPANRLAIELRAFPTVWSRSDARARALIQQMAGDFAQAATAVTQDSDQNPALAITNLRDQRNNLAHTIANTDPEMALLFVNATLPYLKDIRPDDDDDDARGLIVDLAAQVALRNPQRALQLAEQQLKETGDLPRSMIDLLNEVERNDPQAGARLFRDVVDHVRQQNLAEDTDALSFAASLLGNEFSRQSETGKPDSVLRSLADTVVNAALNSKSLTEKYWIWSDAMEAIDALVPSKSAVLDPNNRHALQPVPIPNSFWQKFNQARSNGDAAQTLALLSQAPEDARPEALARAAQDFADRGDLEHTRQIASSLEPWRRNTLIQSAISRAALAAAHHSDFSRARQLAAQITDEDLRAMLLCDIAMYAQGAGKPRVAEELLGEASSLVVNHGASSSSFAAQLKIAQTYLRVKPSQAIPLLERAATQIEQALSAAAQLDGFLPDRHSFEGSELILNQGFLYNSLLEPYASATAELAVINLPAARILADRLSLPEARLMTEVVVATGVLTQKDQTQTASNPTPDVGAVLDNQ
jgi:hypothetical protein